MATVDHGYVLYQRGEDGDSDAWDDTVLIKAYDSAVSAMKAKLAEQHPEFATSPPGVKTKKKRNKSKKKKSVNGATGKWKVGDLCHAVYSEDGEIYEARILSINEGEDVCTVQYVGYGNEEDQLLSNLLPLVSEGSSQDVKTDTGSDTGSFHQTPVVQEFNTGKHRSQKTSSSQNQNTHSKRRVSRWQYAAPPVFPQMPPGHLPSFQPSHLPGYPPAFPPTSVPHFPGYQAAGPNMAPPPQPFPCVPPPPPMLPDHEEENEALYSMLISWFMSGYHTGYYQGLKHSTVGMSAASGHGAPR